MSRRRHVDNVFFDEETEELILEVLPEPLLDAFDSFPRIRGWKRKGRQPRQLVNFTFVAVTLLILSVLEVLRSDRFGQDNESYAELQLKIQESLRNRPFPITSLVPEQLMGLLYHPSDFINVRGVVPTFWHYDPSRSGSVISDDGSGYNVAMTNVTIAPKTASALQINAESNHNGLPSWGPCYPPQDASSSMNWDQEIALAKEKSVEHAYRHNQETIDGGIDGMCRPGFIIIGAGKCGTSSLYHYLTGHPRVLPATVKQIHYFTYNATKPLSWYYSHFPTTTNFLASGALMTGEASPGYLPYPAVPKLMRTSLPDPKIIVIGRSPLERSWSSYKYNYIQPTLEEMENGNVKGIPPGQTKDFYKTYLFSFEEIMRAELTQLKKCLDTVQGFGANATSAMWGAENWTQPELDRRMTAPDEKTGVLQPLVDLDAVCYGPSAVENVLRTHWEDLHRSQPHKILLDINLHRLQAVLGRSLYVFPLEWWYLVYNPKDVHFFCTEELSDLSGSPLTEMAVNHLGLPWFNFSSVVSQGAYNVGDNRGYNQATSWNQVVPEENGNAPSIAASKDSDQRRRLTSSANSLVISGPNIPLSDELLQELQDFIQPFNERLFALVGRRCDW